MAEFKNKNDYSVSVFSGTGFLVKVQFCNDLGTLQKWLDSSYKYKDWKYINVYARRSGRFLGRFYKGNFMPFKPK